jgi:hypothetical protein
MLFINTLSRLLHNEFAAFFFVSLSLYYSSTSSSVGGATCSEIFVQNLASIIFLGGLPESGLPIVKMILLRHSRPLSPQWPWKIFSHICFETTRKLFLKLN